MAQRGAKHDAILFEDIFEVLSKDKDGEKFDRVSRFECKSELYEMDLILDINIDVYPLQVKDKFTLILSDSINTDGTPETGKYDATMFTNPPRKSMLDNYEYVMYGKIFKYNDTQKGGQLRVEVNVSFGGLLMQIAGDPRKLEALEIDTTVYLLMRRL